MRVATWNIQHLNAYLPTHDPQQSFIETLKTFDTDVLALQEVDELNPRSGNVSQTEIAADALGASDFHFLATPPAAGDYGIALISRIPVREWFVFRMPASPIGGWLEFPADNGGVEKIYCKDHERGAIAALLANGNLVVNTHTSFVRPAARVHTWMVVRWAKRLAKQQNARLILCGDLNFTASGFLRSRGLTPLVEQLTFTSWEPTEQIDFIAAQGQVSGTSVPLQRPALSDHLPLAVDLAK